MCRFWRIQQSARACVGDLLVEASVRILGARKRMSIGPHGKLATDGARKLALTFLGDVVRGSDLAEERSTLRNFDVRSRALWAGRFSRTAPWSQGFDGRLLPPAGDRRSHCLVEGVRFRDLMCGFDEAFDHRALGAVLQRHDDDGPRPV